ncbi:hypothetical protein [Acinetobacter haemolyticus]|uniref:hypothetical protein n=1 Tax=Acinetobacter haemolyticus TaxID=29430 RepID=UPI003F54DECD
MSDSRDELQICIDEFRSRGIHFDEVRNLFTAEDIEQPKQWRSVPNIIAHLSDEKLNNLKNKVQAYLDNQKKYNDKLIVIYTDLSESQVVTIDEALTSAKVDDLDLEFDYFFDSIESISGEKNLKFFKFKKTRSVFLKEDIDIDNMDEDVKSEFIEFDKVVGIKAKNITCIDTVVIDTEANSLIVQLDLVSLLRSSDIDKNIDLFQIMINKIISDKFGNIYKLDKKTGVVNFFGCIKNFYDKPEGAVTKLSFTTSKGVHHETLKGAATDIRKADYHLGGKAQEGSISPYRITKKFTSDAKNKPQAYLGVRYQYYAKAGSKSLSTARIFDVFNYQSYLFIIKKLLDNI